MNFLHFLHVVVSILGLFIGLSSSFHIKLTKYLTRRLHAQENIISPFDTNAGTILSDANEDDELSLTRDNVELVLDEMRPYLKSDGWTNSEIGTGRCSHTLEICNCVPIAVILGACGSCPSSSMTMKMGLERKLKERIPEIAEVVQSFPNVPILTIENIETVLDTVRPFLSVAGGKISIVSLTGVGGLQPTVALKMDGTAAALQSVKIEIMQRIQRHFAQSLKIDWVQ